MSENVAIEAGQTRSVTAALALILALACGFIAANLYYAQPLTGLIGAALGLGPAQIGLLVTMTQIGYGLGLILFVPLGDLVENRTPRRRRRRRSPWRRWWSWRSRNPPACS